MEYRFGKAANRCTTCGHTFAFEEAFVSALREPLDEQGEVDESARDDKGFVRQDVCLECWGQADREPLLSWWQNRRAARPDYPPTGDPEFLWLLLSQTRAQADVEPPGGERDVQAAAYAYIAALALLRLKHLRLQRHFRHGGQEFLALVGRESRRHEIVILDPGLSDEEFSLIEDQLVDLQTQFRRDGVDELDMTGGAAEGDADASPEPEQDTPAGAGNETAAADDGNPAGPSAAGSDVP